MTRQARKQHIAWLLGSLFFVASCTRQTKMIALSPDPIAAQEQKKKPEPTVGSTVDRIVAVVGDMPILLSQVDKRVRQYLLQQGELTLADASLENPRVRSQVPEMRKKIAEEMIVVRLAQLGIADKEKMFEGYHITPTAASVDLAMAQQRDTAAQAKGKKALSDEEYLELLKTAGFENIGEYRAELREQITLYIYKSVLTQQSSVSDKQIAAYRKETGEKKRQVRLAQLSIRTSADPVGQRILKENLQQVVKALQQGSHITDISSQLFPAGQVSVARDDTDWLDVGELREDFRKVVLTMSQGEVRQISDDATEWHVIQLLGRRKTQTMRPGEENTTLTDEQIRQKLKSEAGEKSFRAWIEEQKRIRNVDIRL